ncbi:uncharacterized protein LOC114532613 [Dendronephthya gigantea]|uniref:uncharacterized protein LOC114532613 n=1 Tax=Dendronephthya gigantea TaxID=151771 RepID=UPI00106A5721|nr:uncharacterized protein LOC114532613 [Dendronephthya gigantea]
MKSAELPPLPPAKLHSVTTIEVSKDSTNVDMDGTLTNTTYPVYARSLAEAEEALHRFENDTKNRYSVWRCPKDFGSSQIDVTNKRIYWQEFDIGDRITVKSDGVPFIMMGRKVYDCHFGKDRNVKLKEKLRLQREEIVKNETIKTRKIPPTRKLDCPAKVVFCEIIYFPDFKISTNTKYYRGIVAKKIKKGFAAGSVNMQNIERRIYISFPTSNDHIGHPTSVQGTNSLHRVDPKISKKLSELVLSGVRNDKEMKQCLDIYINQELYPGKAKPFHSNKRYFPNTGIIRTKMYNELVLQRLVVLDFPQIEELVAKIKNSDDKVYTRKFDGMSEVLRRDSINLLVEEVLEHELRVRQKFSQQQFILVHQTSFQRHLLKRYGNHVCFLDPVYRTVKYPLPLFFLMVKTNVDYQVVATFVVQDENMESTKEALELIKEWNPDWKPKVFMADNDSEETAAILSCFPDCKVLLSDFHREQAWRSFSLAILQWCCSA